MATAKKTGKGRKSGGAAKEAPEGVAHEANGNAAVKPKKGASKFIRSFPESVMPQDIAQRGKEAGYSFDSAYASSVRSKAKKDGTWSTADGTHGGSGGNIVSEFSKLVRAMGVENAKDMFRVVSKIHEESSFPQFMSLVSALGVARASDVITILETVDIAATPDPKKDSEEAAG